MHQNGRKRSMTAVHSRRDPLSGDSVVQIILLFWLF